MAEKKIHTIYDDNQNGVVQISEDVICIMAGIAATEVEGIASMKGDISATQISRSDMKNHSKCVKVVVTENKTISLYLLLNIKYGYSLPEVTKKVQEKVKDTIENMTGLKVESVNISISEVQMENKKSKK